MPEQDVRAERILFLTGHLALKSLQRILDDMQPLPFEARVLDVGINVAGLMTAELIRRRVPAPVDADRIIVPGRCRGAGKVAVQGHSAGAGQRQQLQEFAAVHAHRCITPR